MRQWVALLVLAPLVAGLAACGAQAGLSTPTATSPAGQAGSAATTANGSGGAETSSGEPALLNDGDNDRSGDADSDNGADNDHDPYYDYKPPANNRIYHDEDDKAILAFGQPAGPVDQQAIALTVKRYYAVALAGEGARACAMIVAGLVKAMPEDYGQYGAPYLRGGKTCAAVLSLLFAHERARLRARVHITSVRVNGISGLAFLGSQGMPASDISLTREGGSWKIAQLLGSPLT